MDSIRGTQSDLEMTRGMVRRQMIRSGNSLLVALEPLDDDEFYRGAPNGISVAWTIGHLACVSDLFGSWCDPRGCILPREAHTTFNNSGMEPGPAKTKAEMVDRDAYPRDHLIRIFRRAQIRALEVLDGLDVQRWNQPLPDRIADVLPTVGAVFEFLAVHTYWHMGELAGCLSRFHGTHTLNLAAHYFYAY